MPRLEKKYHFLYRTTNLKNGRYYLGMHSTSKLDDGYLGSGTRLRRSIRKHGRENFKIEILEFFESREVLLEAEKRLITEDILKDPKCMNLKPGGSGGFSNKEHQLKCSLAGAYAENRIQKSIEAYQQLIKNEEYRNWRFSNLKNGQILSNFDYKTFLGKKHTELSKEKIGKANSIKQKGEGNSQYGSFWITNGVENKKVKCKSDIPSGWYKGRKIKLVA
jgi:hypothetical protein